MLEPKEIPPYKRHRRKNSIENGHTNNTTKNTHIGPATSKRAAWLNSSLLDTKGMSMFYHLMHFVWSQRIYPLFLEMDRTARFPFQVQVARLTRWEFDITPTHGEASAQASPATAPLHSVNLHDDTCSHHPKKGRSEITKSTGKRPESTRWISSLARYG